MTLSSPINKRPTHLGANINKDILLPERIHVLQKAEAGAVPTIAADAFLIIVFCLDTNCLCHNEGTAAIHKRLY